MLKLTIVSGPNRGSSFDLVEGENAIGRDENNRIVLSSGRVSKHHCALIVSNGNVNLRDEGSTNGTFLNGVLVKRQELKSGDKISVGEFVLELVGRPKSNVVPLSSGTSAIAVDHGFSMPIENAHPFQVAQPLHGSENLSNKITVQEPEDPIGKIKVQLEASVMPFFYGWLLKTDFKTVIGIIISVLTVTAALASLMPTLDLVVESVDHEALIRAKLLAREVADRYGNSIATHNESQIDVDHFEREDTIRLVAITTPSLSIIAPQSRINQMLAGGAEAPFLVDYARAAKNGLDKGRGKILGNGIAAYIEPIVVADSRTARPMVAAFAIVSIDYSRNQFAESDQMVFYATAGVIALLIALAAFYLIYRLALKPFEVLSEELDQVLRGNLPRVTNEFRIPELKSLWDSINTLAQKSSSGGGGGGSSNGDTEHVAWDAEASGLQVLADSAQESFCAFDSELNLVAVNNAFEEMSGIRSTSVGGSLSQIGRDRAFILMMEDLHSKVKSTAYGAIQDVFEFSGNNFHITALGIGNKNNRGLAVFFKKKDA